MRVSRPQGSALQPTRFLEYHHLRNWARGAEHEPDEIELRCRAHNMYEATIDYGAAFMAARVRGSRAEEPARWLTAGPPPQQILSAGRPHDMHQAKLDGEAFMPGPAARARKSRAGGARCGPRKLAGGFGGGGGGNGEAGGEAAAEEVRVARPAA